MKRAFVDTSAWYAFMRRDDPDHERVRDGFTRWENRLVTSNFIFDEIVTLVRARLGYEKAQRAGNALRDPNIVELVRILPEDEESAWALFTRHHDKEYSFTDCTSFALMKRLGVERALTTDRHFAQAGFDAEPG